MEGEIAFYYDEEDKLHVSYGLVGEMICPDAITLEDVEVPFDLSEDQLVTQDMEEDGFFFDKDMDIEEMVLYIVMPEVPIKVEKARKIEYIRTGDYSFVSEEEYDSSKKKELDPRLQKFKEYTFEEDE